jgi:hypothetical protein
VVKVLAQQPGNDLILLALKLKGGEGLRVRVMIGGCVRTHPYLLAQHLCRLKVGSVTRRMQDTPPDLTLIAPQLALAEGG